MIRWLRFNAIGMAGAVVQLIALNVLLACGLHYLLATALAVETAILHNYCWHLRWTWKDRRGSIIRFHLANGVVSMVVNLAGMRWLAGGLGMPATTANLIAIVAASLLNYVLCCRFVFRAGFPVPKTVPD